MVNHDRTHFYQYVTMDGARSILLRRSRKWTSPLVFNDPFDTQVDCGFPFSFEEFGLAYMKAIEELTFQDMEPEGDPDHPFFKQIMISRQNRHKRSREQFKAFFEPTIEQSIQDLHKIKAIVSSRWQTCLNRLRILCLTETNSNLLMWAHYAAKHTGAVIRYRCVIERDSVLLAAVPVNYSDQAPYIATIDEWILHLTGQKQLDWDEYSKRFITTKGSQWAHEKEWRIINVRGPDEKDLAMYDQFWPEEIDAVYFGCKADSTEIKSIVNSLPPELEHVKVFVANRKAWEFCLDFQRIR